MQERHERIFLFSRSALASAHTRIKLKPRAG
jgi:hypothetical protein